MSHRVHRAIRLTSTTAAGLCLTALMASGANGQIYTSFVPSNSYAAGEVSIFSVASSANWLAASFGYVGSTVNLSSIRFAGQDNGDPQPLLVNFLVGATMGSAVSLESWSIPGTSSASPDQIYSLTSVIKPTLLSGNTYWLELSVAPYPPNSYYWGWNDANSGVLGNHASSPDLGTTWTNCGASCTALAFDVSASAVTPEPATMGLMAVGLAGMAGAGMRRRKRSR